jgi:hypothetical protein
LASIRKRNHRWEVRVRRGNNPTKCKSFTKLADAKIWAYQTELELERACTPQEEPSKNSCDCKTVERVRLLLPSGHLRNFIQHQ